MTFGVWSEFPIIIDLYITSPFDGDDTFTTIASGFTDIKPLPFAVESLDAGENMIELSFELGIEPC